MDQQQRGIFLLHEGLPATIIESQVLVHVRAMCAAAIPMEVWTFAGTSRTYFDALQRQPRLTRDYGIRIRVFRGVRAVYPGSGWLNAIVLLLHLLRLRARPPFVHARTEYSATVAASLKPLLGFRLIWDSRGDTISEHRLAATRWPRFLQWLAPTIEWVKARHRRIAASRCDKAIFVSTALQRLHELETCKAKGSVIPCLADENVFFFSPELRAQARIDCGYAPGDRVLIYVGSSAIWQCVPETIALLQDAMHANPRVKVLVISPDQAAFQSLLATELRHRVILTTGLLSQVNRYLNAADCGVLLRHHNAINRVASPVKYAEYSLTGLLVITTGAVEQIAEIGRVIGNVLATECANSWLSSGESERQAIARRARAVLGRNAYGEQFRNLYRDYGAPS